MEIWNDLLQREKRELVDYLMRNIGLEIPNTVGCEVSSRRLGSFMKKVDWKNVLYRRTHKLHAGSVREQRRLQRMERIVSHVGKLWSAGSMSGVAAELLQIKHWKGTLMELEMTDITDATLRYIIDSGISSSFIEKLGTEIKIRNNKAQNPETLRQAIRRCGFDNDLLSVIGQNLQSGKDSFQVIHPFIVGEDFCTATLNFSKDKYHKYSFDGFDLEVLRGNDSNQKITVHLSLSDGIYFSREQAYHLAMGRAVGCIKYIDNEPLEMWAAIENALPAVASCRDITIVPTICDFLLEEVLSTYAVMELNDSDKRDAFLQSIRSGEPTHATVQKNDGTQMKVYINADPLQGTINFYRASIGERLDPELFRARDNNNVQSCTVRSEAEV